MAVKLEEIRKAAERVAASHGLDLVDIEFVGPAKERVLRVYLEKNAEGRERLKAEILASVARIGTEAGEDSEAELDEGGHESLPERLLKDAKAGTLSANQLSGITHEDCVAFSRDFGVLLDVEDLVADAEYTLEASSPGLDRKLTKAADFERFVGSLIKVQSFEPVKNNRHWQGRLVSVSPVPKGEGHGAPGTSVSQVSESRPGAPAPVITLDLNAVKQNSKSRKAGVSTVEIALSNVEKAQLIPEI